MAELKPSDVYNPVNSVTPQTGMPNDYGTTKASPAAFGAEVGQAEQKAGSVLQDLGNKGIDVAVQQQGLVNEHAATTAEMQLAVQGGQLYDKYKSMTGFDAVNSKDKAVSDYMAVSNKIRDSLGNPAAQRAYDALATRRMSYTIQDMNAYAATEQKKAYVTGKTASMNLDVDSASRPEVASNPSQFGYLLGGVKFKAYDLFTNPEYGAYKTLPYTVGKDGTVTFDQKTDQGKVAQADMENYINTVTGKVFENAATTLASQNPLKAHDFVEQNKDQMSSATYAKLSHQLAPAVQSEQVRSLVDDRFTSFSDQYQNNPISTTSPMSTITSLFPGIKVTSVGRTPEHNAEVGGVSDSLHLSGQAADVVLPPGVSFEQFKTGLASKGINTTELIDEKDHVHVGWGNKDDSSAPSNYTSYANSLGMNADNLIQGARADARDKGLDLNAQDQAGARMETRINQVLHSEQMFNVANENNIVKDIYGGKFPSQKDLDLDPRFQTLDARNPILAGNIVTRIMPAMAKGLSQDYGTDFYKHLQSTLTGQESLTSLSGYVGSDTHSPISNNGYKVLSGISEQTSTADVAFQHAESEFLSKLHSQYTGSNQIPGISPTESNPGFNKVLMEVIPKINAGRASGKSAAELFDENSKDYVRTGVPLPTPTQIMNTLKARAFANVGQNTPQTYNSPDDLVKALGSKKITRQEFDKIAVEKKWAQATPPPVPFEGTH